MIDIWEVAIALVMSGIMWVFAYLAVSLQVVEINNQKDSNKWTYTEALRMFFLGCCFGAALLSLGIAMEITEGKTVHNTIVTGYAAMMFITITILFILLIRILHRTLSDWRIKKAKLDRPFQ